MIDSGTPVREEDFTLDPTGNWTGYVQKTSGTTILDHDREHNKVNEIDTDDVHGDADNPITETTGTAWADPVYDAAGNMTGVPKPASLANGLPCTYDAWNRLVAVEVSQYLVLRSEYDGLNRRTMKCQDYDVTQVYEYFSSSKFEVAFFPRDLWVFREVHQKRQNRLYSRTRADMLCLQCCHSVGTIFFGKTPNLELLYFYHNSSWQVLENRGPSSSNEPEELAAFDQYIWSARYIDAPVLREYGGTRYYYLGDANFNVTTLVDTSGDAREHYQYDPYGKVTILNGGTPDTDGDVVERYHYDLYGKAAA